MNIIRNLMGLFLSYLLAAMMSKHVFMDLRLTEWDNLWTYFWLLFSVPVIYLCLIGIGALIYAVLALIVAALN